MADRKSTESRMIGLGEVPSPAAANAFTQCGFTQVPVIEYVTWTTTVPLTSAEIASTFSNQINVLQGPNTVPGIISVDSSFVLNGLLQTDMVVFGFGIHIFGEPLSFSAPGNAVEPAPVAGTAAIVSPDVFTGNDLTNGALGPTTGIVPAVLEWGMADWEAAWHMANAYEFVWRMNQRYNVIQELVADVCYFGPYAEAEAAGTSEVPIQEYARQVNDTYRTKGAGGIFAPINFRRVGSVTVQAANVGVFHPTRDFDFASVTWGGLRNQGGAACCQPFRKLPRPVLLERGIPIGMSMNAKDQYHLGQMQKFLSLNDQLGGTLATVGYDANITSVTNAGGANTGLELTLDQGANVLVKQNTQTDRVVFKGGAIKIAVLVKGVEVWGGWKQYIASNMGDYISMPTLGAPPPAFNMGR